MFESNLRGTNGLKIASNSNPNVYVSYAQALDFLDANIKPNLPVANYSSVLVEFDNLAVKDYKGQKGKMLKIEIKFEF